MKNSLVLSLRTLSTVSISALPRDKWVPDVIEVLSTYKPQLSHLYNRHYKIYIAVLLWELNEICEKAKHNAWHIGAIVFSFVCIHSMPSQLEWRAIVLKAKLTFHYLCILELAKCSHLIFSWVQGKLLNF